MATFKVIGILLIAAIMPATPSPTADCPPPFPTMQGTLADGSCQCRSGIVGIRYSCIGLKLWPRITESNSQAVEALVVFGSASPASVLRTNFLASYAPRVVEFKCNRCGVTRIEANAFANVGTLRSINLDDNPLLVLHAHSFANLRGLIEISIRRTTLQLVAADAFFNLRSITYVYLTDNANMVVEAGAFRTASNIDQLDLTDHGMRSLNGSFLAGLSNVKFIVLSSKHGIAELGAGALDGLRNVTKVILVSSGLKQVHSGAFAGAVGIESVLLHQNDIRTIENGTLGDGVATVEWNGNPIDCNASLAWIFGKGGLGDGLRASLLHEMRCQQPMEWHHSLVTDLRDKYDRRGYLPWSGSAANVSPSGGRPNVASQPPTSANPTQSALMLQLRQYVVRMNSTKNRRRNSGLPRVPADGRVVALGVVLAATTAVIFS